MTTCREMSRTTKEPCGKPLPCADHSTPTNAPAAPQPETTSTIRLNDHPLGLQMQPETEGMTFDEWDVLPRDEEVPSLMAAWESLEPIAGGGFAHFSNGYRMAMSYARKRIAAWTAAKGGR